jgi:hypothetical protein
MGCMTSRSATALLGATAPTLTLAACGGADSGTAGGDAGSGAGKTLNVLAQPFHHADGATPASCATS